MFRNMFAASSSMILGLGLCTIGGAMLYVYYRDRDDEEVSKDKQENTQKTKGKSQKSKQIMAQILVDNQHVPVILGRNGINLSMIEEKTNTKIIFRDKDEQRKYCEIMGSTQNVRLATTLVKKEIERAPIVAEEMFLPQSVYGRIIGRCGEAMQEICRASMAKVSLEAGAASNAADCRRLTIKGNRSQVNMAIKLLEEKIGEDTQLQRKLEDLEVNRGPRRSPSNSVHSSHSSLSTPKEKLVGSLKHENGVEVYVSAIASPSKFWVQMIGTQSNKLDELVNEMTTYYANEENRKEHIIEEPYLGQIVAAEFKYDGKWYRAEIVGILPNEYNKDEIVLDVYFVDYGDSEYVAPHEVFRLRPDFLTLRFQAVECFLANLKSTSMKNDNHWEPQAIEKFEDLTQVASWKKLIARVVTYKERTKTAKNNNVLREGSPIPGIELYDLTEGVEVNIGHMLISHGFATPYQHAQTLAARFNESPRLADTPRSTDSQLSLKAPTVSSTSTYLSAQENDIAPLSPSKQLIDNHDNEAESVEDKLDAALDTHLAAQIQHLHTNNKVEKGTNIFFNNSHVQVSEKQNGLNATR